MTILRFGLIPLVAFAAACGQASGPKDMQVLSARPEVTCRAKNLAFLFDGQEIPGTKQKVRKTDWYEVPGSSDAGKKLIDGKTDWEHAVYTHFWSAQRKQIEALFDLKSTYRIERVEVWATSGRQAGNFIDAYTIETSPDGKAWQTVKRIENPYADDTADPETYPMSSGPIDATGRFVRVTCHTTAPMMVVGEITILGTRPDSPPPVAEDRNLATCPELARPPQVDGQLGETEWAGATRIRGFVQPFGGLAKNQTTVYLGYHDDRLYLGFRCEAAYVKGSPAKILARDGAVWTDESLEVFLMPGEDGTKYFHLLLNPAGTQCDAQGQVLGAGLVNVDLKWNGKWTSSARVDDRGWSAEFSIPFRTLGVERVKPGQSWRCNFNRNAAAGAREESGWAPTFGGFHCPENFGHVRFGAEPVSFDVIGLGEADKTYTATVKLVNPKSTTATLAAETEVLGQGSKTMAVCRQIAALAAGATRSVSLPYRQGLRKGDRNVLRVNVWELSADGQSRRQLARSVFPLITAVEPRKIPGVLGTSNAGATIWGTIATRKVFSDDTVEPLKGQKTLVLNCARNEYESFQVVVGPSPNIDPLKVRIVPEDFVGADGRRITKDRIKVYLVGKVEVARPTDTIGATGFWPDPLIPHWPADELPGLRAAKIVKPGNLPGRMQNGVFWITVFVPAETVGGRYEGAVQILSGDAPVGKIDVSLNVWNFVLPKYAVHPLRSSPTSCIPGLYRMNGFAGFLPYQQKIENGHVVIPEIEDPTLRARLEAMIEIVKQSHEPIMQICNYHLESDTFQGYKWTTPEFEKYLREYVQKLYQFYAAHGLGDKLYFYLFDEPLPSHYPMMIRAGRIVKHAVPGLKIEVAFSHFNFETLPKDLVDLIDIWGCPYKMITPALLDYARTHGKQVWPVFNLGTPYPYPGLFVDHPAISPRIIPWVNFKYGLGGIYQWGNCSWAWSGMKINPFDDPTVGGFLPAGDGWILYPDAQKAPRLLSIRLELLREGLEDYDYLYLLAEKVRQLRSAGTGSPEVQSMLNEAKELLAIPIVRSLTDYTSDPNDVERLRSRVAQFLERMPGEERGKP